MLKGSAICTIISFNNTLLILSCPLLDLLGRSNAILQISFSSVGSRKMLFVFDPITFIYSDIDVFGEGIFLANFSPTSEKYLANELLIYLALYTCTLSIFR